MNYLIKGTNYFGRIQHLNYKYNSTHKLNKVTVCKFKNDQHTVGKYFIKDLYLK